MPGCGGAFVGERERLAALVVGVGLAWWLVGLPLMFTGTLNPSWQTSLTTLPVTILVGLLYYLGAPRLDVAWLVLIQLFVLSLLVFIVVFSLEGSFPWSIGTVIAIVVIGAIVLVAWMAPVLFLYVYLRPAPQASDPAGSIPENQTPVVRSD